MEFYKILQSIIDEYGLTIPETARLCGLSDSTIRTILTRKNKSVSLEVAFKLSSGLNVSLERLNYGVSTSEPDKFTPEEKSLVYSYRQASEDDRSIVDMALRKYRTTDS